MAELVAALPRIIIDFHAFTLIYYVQVTYGRLSELKYKMRKESR